MCRDVVLVVIMFWSGFFAGGLMYMEMHVLSVILLVLSLIAIVKVIHMGDDE